MFSGICERSIFTVLRAERRGQGAVKLQRNLMLGVHHKINRAWLAWTGGCAYHSQLLVRTLQHKKTHQKISGTS